MIEKEGVSTEDIKGADRGFKKDYYKTVRASLTVIVKIVCILMVVGILMALV